MKKFDFYNNQDPRNIPLMTATEAAHYLNIPIATLRSWIRGYPYETNKGQQYFKPVIKLFDNENRLLSFINVVEAHILNALTKVYKIRLPKVRIAIEYIKQEFNSDHPLANHSFQTNGIDLFVQEYGKLINVTKQGQLSIKEVLEAHLKRVEWDASGTAKRLFLFTRKHDLNESKIVMIDPCISFGRPVLYGTGIPTSVIADRFKAGEDLEDLAKDYEREQSEILEAIRCELKLEAAA